MTAAAAFDQDWRYREHAELCGCLGISSQARAGGKL